VRSKLRIARGTLALAAAASLACGDGPSGPSESSLVGVWSATKIEMASVADPNITIDGLAGGGTLTLTMDVDHTWHSIQTEPGEPNLEEDGTWSLHGRTLTMMDDGGESEDFRASCSGNTMTLVLYTTADIDLDGDEDDVKVTMVFVK
jgi:hypothetical protein